MGSREADGLAAEGEVGGSGSGGSGGKGGGSFKLPERKWAQASDFAPDDLSGSWCLGSSCGTLAPAGRQAAASIDGAAQGKALWCGAAVVGFAGDGIDGEGCPQFSFCGQFAGSAERTDRTLGLEFRYRSPGNFQFTARTGDAGGGAG